MTWHHTPAVMCRFITQVRLFSEVLCRLYTGRKMITINEKNENCIWMRISKNEFLSTAGPDVTWRADQWKVFLASFVAESDGHTVSFAVLAFICSVDNYLFRVRIVRRCQELPAAELLTAGLSFTSVLKRYPESWQNSRPPSTDASLALAALLALHHQRVWVSDFCVRAILNSMGRVLTRG